MLLRSAALMIWPDWSHGGVLDGAIMDIKLSRLFFGPTAAEIAG